MRESPGCKEDRKIVKKVLFVYTAGRYVMVYPIESGKRQSDYRQHIHPIALANFLLHGRDYEPHASCKDDSAHKQGDCYEEEGLNRHKGKSEFSHDVCAASCQHNHIPEAAIIYVEGSPSPNETTYH
jgi:hypothetical protein